MVSTIISALGPSPALPPRGIQPGPQQARQAEVEAQERRADPGHGLGLDQRVGIQLPTQAGPQRLDPGGGRLEQRRQLGAQLLGQPLEFQVVSELDQ